MKEMICGERDKDNTNNEKISVPNVLGDGSEDNCSVLRQKK